MLSRPPEITALTSEQAKSLNDNLKREIDRLKCPGYKPALGSMLEPKRYYSSGPHPVQAVRSCPWPSCIMLGCTSLKANSFIRGRTSFLAHAPNKTKLSQGIRRDFARVEAMVEAHPCLKLDFQVFLRNDGSVLNIDLDRCYQLELATSMPLASPKRGISAESDGISASTGSPTRHLRNSLASNPSLEGDQESL